MRGPLEALRVLPEHFRIVTLGERQGPVASAQGPQGVVERTLDDPGPIDVLLVPGGMPKVELPAHLVATKWARCASVQGESSPNVPTFGWFWNAHARIASPPGIGRCGRRQVAGNGRGGCRARGPGPVRSRSVPLQTGVSRVCGVLRLRLDRDGFFASSVFRRMVRARGLQLPHLVFIRCRK